MKLVHAVAIIGLLVAGAPLAIAQNAPTNKVAPSPNSINKGSRATVTSGTESRPVASGKPEHVAGHGKYCRQTSPSQLSCNYASMSACEKGNKKNSLHCVTNPQRG